MLKWMLGLMMLCGMGSSICLGQEGAPAVDPPAVTSAEPAVVAPVAVAPESAPAAAPASTLNTGDQAWLLASSAMVLLMTPGLAFFYGGLVGRKNVLSILMQCFMCMGVVTVLWVLVGYSIAFSGAEVGGKLGISQQTFMVFQMMFAIITPALMIGAFAERMKFLAFTVFIALWSLLVYSPVAHWVWFGPSHWLFGLGSFSAKDAVPEGALDFAGGTVVHINAGIAALVACLMIGPRRGYPKQVNPPHNLPFAVLGAGLLWFGWFGFNGGSAFGATPQAVQAFVTTQVAAATAH